jgi:hypothetical protein
MIQTRVFLQEVAVWDHTIGSYTRPARRLVLIPDAGLIPDTSDPQSRQASQATQITQTVWIVFWHQRVLDTMPYKSKYIVVSNFIRNSQTTPTGGAS